MKKSPFIEGFKQPTLSKNSYSLLSDIRGDGQGKLVIWLQEEAQLIVYKGSNREVQKPVKVKNYYDEQSSTQPVIGLAAENALYIFRGMMESFRIKIPDVIAEVEEQLIWSQYKENPDKITTELSGLKNYTLSSKAKQYLSTNSQQTKKQIIQQIFLDGMNQKDAISAVTVIKQNDGVGVGNVVLGTQLNRLYILDTYGHRIINERIIDCAPCFLYAYGNFEKKYLIIAVSRQGNIFLYLNNKNEAAEQINLSSRVVSGCLSYPQFSIATVDQVIYTYSLSSSNIKISQPKHTLKLSQQPLKLQYLKKSNVKLLLAAFQKQFRLFRDKQVIYRHQTEHNLYNFILGSFARQDHCLILFYQNNGFQVLIFHRLFNPKETYQIRKSINRSQKKKDEIQLQLGKKTAHFLKYWDAEPDKNLNYKLFERNMKLLRWRTLKGKTSQGVTATKIEVNPKILGLGPYFIVKLEIQNISNSPIFNARIIITQENQFLQFVKTPDTISMLAPFTPTLKQVQVRSISLKPERFKVELSWKDNLSSTIVCLPGCAEMQG